MLNDEKHANTDSFKTITEQQWRLDRLSERVSVIDKKEAQRRSMEVQQTLQTDELVIAFHEMALHPVRNVLPTDAQWSALASLVETVAPDFYVIKESRIPSPIQISIIASVLRPNVPNTPILSVDQPQN